MLESRLAPSVTVSGRDLYALGTPAADSYLVRIGAPGILQVYENNPSGIGAPTFSGRLTDFSTVTVKCYDGTDQIFVDFVNGNPVPVDGLWADTGNSPGDRLTIRGNSVFSTEVYTPTDPVTGTIVLSRPQVPASRITYVGVPAIDDTLALNGFPMEGLTVNATTGTDVINVVNGAPLSGLTTTLVSSGGTFSQLTFANKPAMILQAHAGSDVININNPTRAAGLNNMIIYPGAGSDVVNVRGTAAGVSTFVDTAVGATAPAVTDNDTVNVGNTTSSLDGLAGALTVEANPVGTSTLTFDDQGDGTVNDYTVTSLSLARVGSPTVWFDRFDSVQVNAGTNSDTIHVMSPASVTTLNAGGGDDTIAFAAGAGITGTLNGGAGVNRLDYSACTSDLLVSLLMGTADGVGGGISNIRNVMGGAGNDIIVGYSDNNRLEGGPGRDLLIGRDGDDILIGGDGEDILIGGWTTHDAFSSELNDIRREWTRTDLPPAFSPSASVTSGTPPPEV